MRESRDNRGAFAERYRQALRDYLIASGEESLLRAYDLGRQAVASKLSIVDLVAIHHQALLSSIPDPAPGRDSSAETRRLIELGQEFLEQCVVPFEMVARGFLEASELNLELERVSEHKSAFLASTSHELRTPLNAILGYTELILEDRSGRFDAPTRQSFVEIIHESGQHLLSLINDILDLSKVEAGRMELYLDRIVLTEVVEHALRTIAPLAEPKRIALRSDLASVGEISADPGRLTQILHNLLSNAVKFTPEGGQVAVRAWMSGAIVAIEVSDTGIGIAPEDQERIFDEFQQLDLGPARRYEGTGLGLPLTKRLVEMHGGRIRVDSAPGQGTRFIIELPVAPATLPRVEPVAS